MLKDWKKIRKDVYQKNLKGYHFNQIRIGKTELNVYTHGIKPYYVDFYKDGVYKRTKRFKTKSQALKFAKSYMRKH